MKTCILLLSLCAIVLARPQESKDAVILRSENENLVEGGYKFGFESSDGITREETGQLKNPGTENESMDVKGSYSSKDPASGKTVSVKYVADDLGFRPVVSIS